MTGRSCTRCERPACTECLTDAPVGAHCFECMRAGRLPADVRRRQWNATAGPLLTKVLIGANAAVFLLTAASASGSASGNLERRLVLFGPSIALGEWYRLITAGFVHFGAIHLLFNMFLLWQFGQMLEAPLGRVRFGSLYLCSLLGGSFGAVLLSPLAFTGGASGAVFGLVGAAAVGVRRRGFSVWQSGIGPLLALNLAITFAIPGISIGGHLGGLVAGAACGWFLFSDAPTSPRSSSPVRLSPSHVTVIEGTLLAVALCLAATGGAVWAAWR